MTREEFRAIDDWDELVYQAREYDYDLDVADKDQVDDWIDGQLVDWARNNTWQDLRDTLYNFPSTSYGYYYRINYDYDEVTELDGDDFLDLKEEFESWLDDNDFFDEEEDDDDSSCIVSGIRDEVKTKPSSADVIFETEFTFDELFADSRAQIKHVETTKEDMEEADQMILELESEAEFEVLVF